MARNTRQRAAICAAFESGSPLTAAQALGLARVQLPGLGMATVYRAVRELLAAGELSCVELPGEPLRYELAGRGHHHHFQCRACSGVFEVQGCPAGLTRLAPRGFTVESHELVLYGLCDRCAA